MYKAFDALLIVRQLTKDEQVKENENNLFVVEKPDQIEVSTKFGPENS